MKSQVFILGNFGYVTNHLDGQTMESRSLRELIELNGINNYEYFDTQSLQFNRKSFLRIFPKLFRAKKLFYLGAQRSVRYFFPFVWLLCKLLRIEFHFFVVGGWIAEFINDKPIHRFMMKRIESMYCETKSIVKKLEDWYGFKNAVWFPNFRIYDFEPDIVPKTNNTLKLVFMSRIVKHKGYHRVFNFADYISKKGITGISIDFFGPLYPSDREYFMNELDKYEFTRYKGVLEPKVINQTLAEYDAMLFPTSYPGEGLPGTIIDSYISGIPVIASNWRYNSELIDDGKSGLLFDLENEVDFYKHILFLKNNPEILYQMKLNAFSKSKEFDQFFVWDIIKTNTKL